MLRDITQNRIEISSQPAKAYSVVGIGTAGTLNYKIMSQQRDTQRDYESEEKVYATQKANIRKHLEEGKSITPLEALKLYGCFRLAAQIFILKDEGMDIQTEMIKVGKNKRCAKYTLVK